MAANTFLLISTVLLIPLTYLIVYTIRVVKSIRGQIQAALQWPGSEIHWFWGTVHEVRNPILLYRLRLE